VEPLLVDAGQLKTCLDSAQISNAIQVMGYLMALRRGLITE